MTYYPFSLNYSATWAPKGSITTADAGLTFAARELGSDTAEFDLNRFKAEGNFFYLRGDISHQHDLPAGFQVFGKLQGQVADQPLVNSEQFAGGGLGTVRGYLEAEVLGDDGVAATVELRSPNVLPTRRYWRATSGASTCSPRADITACWSRCRNRRTISNWPALVSAPGFTGTTILTLHSTSRFH